ncbi:hypothetical protein NA56DRAFT_205734 [Hyaloscypha hepaticicola]|uniref:Uncharacterized protein n=1 Tax=Hyaloscypha hepaticicola TaxID=2082293 RepID=A0A2J6PYU3_9HELO|nr:hypothetical protein NA56DRAFT_205734 [Hyaloscypha hepaticicola]
MATTADTNLGALVSLTAPKDGGNTWTAKQIETVTNTPPAPGVPNAQVPISWSLGPIKLSGYVDTSSFAISVNISIVGISLGTIYGNLKDGVGVNVDLWVASGSLRFYLKNGNELWIHVDIKISFDGSFSGDYKIISF